MNKLVLALAAPVALLAAVPSSAADRPRAASGEEARVPFLHLGTMRSFRATDENTLYVEAAPRRWYRVTTMGPCRNLPWAEVIGVDTHGGSTFDRFSTLLVDRERCDIASVVRSEEPPHREHRRRR